MRNDIARKNDSSCACVAPSLYYYGMFLNRAISAGRSSQSWLSLCVRIFCVLALCLAYLFTSGGRGGLSPKSAPSGAIAADKSGDVSGGFCCGSQDFETDAILTSERENNPLLFLLSLRAGCVSCPFPRIKFVLSEVGACRVASAPPDILSAYLDTLAQSAQLLC